MNNHAAHPSSVTLAAFVDGRLAGKDLSRVMEHLAACQDCFEVVAETAEVQEELEEEAGSAGEAATAKAPTRQRIPLREALPDNVVVRPSAWRRWAPVTALLAAALAVVVVGGRQMGWLLGDPLSMDRLAERLESASRRLDGAALKDWGWLTYRDLEPSPNLLNESQASFRVGVVAVDLQMALRADDLAQAQELSRELNWVLNQDSLENAGPIRRGFREVVIQPLESRAAPALDLEELAAKSAELDKKETALAFLNRSSYELGKWAEAGRLAARAKDARALGGWAFRTPIEDFLEANLDPQVTKTLQEIQQRLHGGLDEEDLDWLARAFRSIVGGDGVRLQPEIPEPELPTDTSLPSSSPER